MTDEEPYKYKKGQKLWNKECHEVVILKCFVLQIKHGYEVGFTDKELRGHTMLEHEKDLYVSPIIPAHYRLLELRQQAMDVDKEIERIMEIMQDAMLKCPECGKDYIQIDEHTYKGACKHLPEDWRLSRG
jgi:hypothetical protein